MFATSEAVNAALRHLIGLAGIMGEEALKQAIRETETTDEEKVIEEKAEETKPVPVEEFQSTDDDEEWFDLPVEDEKTE